MSNTPEKVERAIVGINHGVTAMTEYRHGRPTLITGTGRSGTTALARCFLNSPGVEFVTSDESKGSTLEHPLGKMINEREANGAAGALEDIERGVARDFVFKYPRFDFLTGQYDDEFPNRLEGCNLIVMTRDPVLVAARECTISSKLSFSTHWKSCIHQSAVALRGIEKLTQSMGVLIVSYEKLITIPLLVADDINAWFGSEKLTKDGVNGSISPNNVHYLERQALGRIMDANSPK